MAPTGDPIPFDFLPGQFLTLTLDQDGKTIKRSYTMASSPTQRDYVELTIKREERGVVSRYLHDRVREGDVLQVAAPQGTFTFTGIEGDSIVLIGGGVGLTPLMSVIRYLTDRGWPQDIYLLYCCRSTEDFVFREELEHLQRRHANLHVVATMTRAEGTTWMGPTGRLTKELLVQTVPDLPSRWIHLCGPPAMMDALRAILLDLGVPRGRIKTEAFGPAEKPQQRQAAVQAAMAEAHPVTTPTVTFTLSGKAAPLPPGTTVLEAAEHVGVLIDSSCRVGTCGTCKVILLKGSVTMAVEDALDRGESPRPHPRLPGHGNREHRGGGLSHARARTGHDHWPRHTPPGADPRIFMSTATHAFPAVSWAACWGSPPALMLIPLVYLIVKRLPWLKQGVTRAVSMRSLLAIHMYAGVLGPILGVLHSGHTFNSPLGISLTAMMIVVVLVASSVAT